MAASLLSSATRTIMEIGLLEPHVIPSVSIYRSPVQSNIAQYIAYKISERWILQYWDYHNLTDTSDWDEIDLTFFKRARETTTVHMEHFITKCMINTLPSMKILHRR